jgi:hypothetical protein
VLPILKRISTTPSPLNISPYTVYIHSTLGTLNQTEHDALNPENVGVEIRIDALISGHVVAPLLVWEYEVVDCCTTHVACRVQVSF